MSADRTARGRRPRLRRVEPGTSYLITKKCSDDRFAIRPCTVVNQILLYLLAEKAARYGVLVHGFCFMSNHLHLVITDVRGLMPLFMKTFLGESSKAIKVALKTRRSVWTRKRYDDTKLLDLDAAERKLAYTILNPTRAKLTTPRGWPGLNSGQWTVGEEIVVTRPSVYFSPRYRKAEVALVLAPLSSSFELGGSKESVARVEGLVAAGVAEVRRELRRDGATFAGADCVLRASRRRRGNRPVGGLKPRFATRDRALLNRAIADEAHFRLEHQAAKDRYVGGHQQVVFPPGTYGYRQVLGVRVAVRKGAS